jgi:hypothetical protein
MVINVKIGNLVCRFSHDNFIDITKSATIDLLFVRNVASVSRQVVFVEWCPIRQETTTIRSRY